jgi:hypothetical protein
MLGVPKPAEDPATEDDDDAALEAKTMVEAETTGEEGDTILINLKGVLLHTSENTEDDRSWMVRGTGTFHFNKSQGCYRIVMRRDAVATTMLNMRVWPGMKPRIAATCASQNCIMFLGLLAAEKDTRIRAMMLEVADETVARNLLDTWLAAIDDITAAKGTVPAATGE